LNNGESPNNPCASDDVAGLIPAHRSQIPTRSAGHKKKKTETTGPERMKKVKKKEIRRHRGIVCGIVMRRSHRYKKSTKGEKRRVKKGSQEGVGFKKDPIGTSKGRSKKIDQKKRLGGAPIRQMIHEGNIDLSTGVPKGGGDKTSGGSRNANFLSSGLGGTVRGRNSKGYTQRRGAKRGGIHQERISIPPHKSKKESALLGRDSSASIWVGRWTITAAAIRL